MIALVDVHDESRTGLYMRNALANRTKRSEKEATDVKEEKAEAAFMKKKEMK